MATGVSRANNSSLNLEEQTRTINNALGKDQFLQLLITQLQNQDPLAPQDNSQMIAQMAQFSTLEAMNNLTSSFSQTQSYSMIGKGVIGQVRDAETGVTHEVGGVVDSAGMRDGKAYVMVGDMLIWADNITQVFDSAILSGNAEDILAASALVGKYVRASLPGEDGAVTSLEGRVEKIVIQEGKVFLLVGDQEISLFQLTEISSEPFPE